MVGCSTMHSLWTWFVNGSNAQAIQTVFTVFLGPPTLYFLIRATAAANAQAAAATKQEAATRALIKEETRPILDIVRTNPSLPWSDKFQQFVIKNIGRGTAYNLTYHFMEFDSRSAPVDLGWIKNKLGTTIPPGQDIHLTEATPADFEIITIYYESSIGDLYESRIWVHREAKDRFLFLSDVRDRAKSNRTFVSKYQDDFTRKVKQDRANNSRD